MHRGRRGTIVSDLQNQPDGAEAVPAWQIVQRVANELRSLHVGATGIDDAVGRLLESEVAFSPAQCHDLQFLDFLCQSLECLALFLEKTALDMDRDCVCYPQAAATGLPLNNLAQRLGAPSVDARDSATSPGAPTTALPPGGCTFF